MKSYRQSAGRLAKGFDQERLAGKKIAIVFDYETFDEVRAIALKRGASFASVVRELVEFGLADLEGAERPAPSAPTSRPAARKAPATTVAVPGWVPSALRDEYVTTAMLFGEEEAASHIRSIKRVAA